jgi:hypothetical protein
LRSSDPIKAPSIRPSSSASETYAVAEQRRKEKGTAYLFLKPTRGAIVGTGA